MEQLIFGVAQHCAKRRIDLHERAACNRDGDACGGPVEGVSESFLAFAQRIGLVKLVHGQGDHAAKAINHQQLVFQGCSD